MPISKIRTRWIAMVVCIMILAISPPLPIPGRAGFRPQAMNFTLEGKITKQDSGKLTVSTEQNIIFHVSYDEKTEIKRSDDTQASRQDLRVGVHIKVDGELAESGEINARKIVIEKDQKGAASLAPARTFS